jgi:hypothetical protein
MRLGSIRVKDGVTEFLASAAGYATVNPIDPAIVAAMLRNRLIRRSCSQRPYHNIRFYTANP